MEFTIKQWLDEATTFKQFGYCEISHGTLRTEDLLNASVEVCKSILRFTPIFEEVNEETADVRSALNYIINRKRELDEEMEELLSSDDDESTDDFMELLSALEEDFSALYNDTVIDTFNNLCPYGVYFGSSEGDGSSIGFWKDLDCFPESNSPLSVGELIDDDDFNLNEFPTSEEVAKILAEAPTIEIAGIPAGYQLITDSQDIISAFESIGHPELAEEFQGIFVKQVEGDIVGLYAFVGTVPYSWKKCWAIISEKKV